MFYFFLSLRMYRTVNLTTLNVPAISLIIFFILKPVQQNCLFHLHGELL